MERSIAVTGLGSVCALGHDCTSLADAVEAGRCGIGPIQRFDTDGFRVRTGAEVRSSGELTVDPRGTPEDLCIAFARPAAREALAQAGAGSVAPERCAIVFGTNLADLTRPVHELASELADGLEAQGPRLTICTACSSSTGALGIASDLLWSGAADLVLAGGADVLTPRVFAGFHALGVLNPDRCAPFSQPFGTTLGEGAGFLVLERAEHAHARGASILASLSGYGLSADGYHETSPDPGGRGVSRAIRAALSDAGLEPEDISYVNAHGSGTEANDPSEWNGIRHALAASANLWVSSSKGAIGHAQGAAGALETIVTILMMRKGLVPPTLNFVGPRPFAPDDPVGGRVPRARIYEHAVCVNSGFGGANAAVVVSRTSAATVRPRARARVMVGGLGVVGPGGFGLEAWQEGGRRGWRGRMADFSLAEVDPRLDPHGLDRSARFLTAASAFALRDAGIRLTRRDRESAGLVLGSIRPSPESVKSYGESVEEHGLAGASAPAFARIVLNAPAGFCAKLLSIQGPLTAVTVGSGSGLAAILVAAEQLRR
ncbi:MAG: beta-ketoacyl-[acyl-carrier-protein] synthase family protein, partial [Longimicrobiales bacterium]|nr:beta-ketoacyl-[acyl-carrier-protein] synthase family protein [Longimicrobiales bacterium]